jgi:asparagine synthase (glutamine-hydrolysing)
VSRIAGVWNLDETPVEPGMVHTMIRAAVSSLPAPFGEPYVLARGEIGLGYRPTLAGLAPEDGIFVTRGDRPLFVGADACLDNRPQLAADLGLGEQAPGLPRSDAELITLAYQRWGPDCVAHLLGAFAFALWDPAERRLLCARDHVGARPLYYQRTAQRFAFASEIKQIRALSDGPVTFDEAAIGLYLVDVGVPPEATYFADIAQVPPAHRLIVTLDNQRRQRYWDVDPQRRIRYQDDTQYGEHFRELFIEAVRCRLRPHESTGVLLSGGLDSSSVASVAAWLHERGEDVPWPLHTFSWLYNELSSADEREYSAAVNEAYGLTAHGMVADNLWPLRDDSESITDLDEPFTGYYQSLVKDALQIAQDVGIDVLFTGHGGDNLVGANVFSYPDFLWRGQWNRLARELWQHSQHSDLNVLQLFWQACVKPAAPLWLKWGYGRLPMRQRKQIPDWIAPAFAARINLAHLVEETDRSPRGFALSRGTRYRTIFFPHVIKAVIEHDRLASRLGMACRHPWLDKRLIEFVLAVPTDQTIRSGLRKIVLRNALRGILPEKVLTRRHKTYPDSLFHRGLRERERSKVEDLLTNTRMAEYGWVSEEPLREQYARYVAGEMETARILWQAITLELWLREHF